MNKKKILIAVSEWGYGPISTLKVIIDEIYEKYDFVFVGKEKHVLDFVKKNMNYIQEEYIEMDEVSFKDIDLILNCMDIESLLYAWKYGIPVYTIDNLYFFWGPKWERSDYKKVKEIVLDVTLPIKDKIQKLYSLPNYQGYLSIYILSKYVFLQHYVELGQDMWFINKDNVYFIDPIIKRIAKEKKKKTKVLVSFSGLITPVTTMNDISIYMYLVKILLNELLNEGITNIIITTPKASLVLAKEILGSMDIEITSMDQKTFLYNLKEAKIILCPCGFSTTFEALYYKTPVFFLPEFHDGNIYNYHGIVDFNICKYKKLSNVYPAMNSEEMGLFKYRTVEELYDGYRKILCDKNKLITIKRIAEKKASLIKKMCENHESEYMYQMDMWKNKFSTFNGEREIIRLVEL